MRSMSAHPRIVAVLQAIIGPDVKCWFDHVFCKPPLNAFDHSGYAKGANRYHQDGFFQFSRERKTPLLPTPVAQLTCESAGPSVTCWISIDDCGVAFLSASNR